MTGPPPHLRHLEQVWECLPTEIQAKMLQVSIEDIEDGIEHAKTTADQRALDLATDEHDQVVKPLKAKANVLHTSADAARADIRASKRALQEVEARIETIIAQQQSTDAAITAAERHHESCISGLRAQGNTRVPPTAPTALQSLASATSATYVAPTASQSLASAISATYVAPAAPQPPASAKPATNVAFAVPQPAVKSKPSTTAAQTTIPVQAAPTTGSVVHKSMLPPAPRERMGHSGPAPVSDTPWTTVVSRNQHRRQQQQDPVHNNETFLDIRISTLMHHNKRFPSHNRIHDLVCDIQAALGHLRCRHPTLRFAKELATQSRSPLCPELVEDILALGSLMKRAYALPEAANWIRTTIQKTTDARQLNMTDSSASDSSIDTGHHRRREEPSSGRGNSKRAAVPGTSDSDTSIHSSRRPGRTRSDKWQVTPTIYHAAERDDSDEIPFPPRIARPRESALRPFSRVTATSAATAPLPPPAPSADSAFSMQSTIETITAQTIAAIDRHLASIGLYPRFDPASSHNTVKTNCPSVASAPVSAPPPPAGSVVSTSNACPRAALGSVAAPPSPAGSVAPTT